VELTRASMGLFCRLGLCCGQEFAYKARDPSVRQPGRITNTAAQDNADHTSVLEINRASACSWPVAAVYEHRECAEVSILVASNETHGAYRCAVVKRKTAECYRRSIRGRRTFEFNGSYGEGRATWKYHAPRQRSADGNIKTRVCMPESETMRSECEVLLCLHAKRRLRVCR